MTTSAMFCVICTGCPYSKGYYKLCLLMHLVHNDRAPVYLADSVTATANISRRIRLRSASSFRYEQPRTRLKLGERCFALPAQLPGTVCHHTFKNSPVQTLSNGTLKLFYWNNAIPVLHHRPFLFGFILCVTFVTRWSCFITVSVELYELMNFSLQLNYKSVISKYSVSTKQFQL